MKNFKKHILGLIIVTLISCNTEKHKPANELVKLTDLELIERARQKKFVDIEKIVYKNEKGEIITHDSIQKISGSGDWAYDQYSDSIGTVKELVIRKSTKQDKALFEEIIKAFNSTPLVKAVDIDCTDKANILERTHDLDQNMRMTDDDNDMDQNIDEQNLITIVSLIEKCGMPTLNEVSQKQMNAIWLVIQHSDNAHRKKYFPHLKMAAENGDLNKANVALMEDRILLKDGKPQIYGSQLLATQFNAEGEPQNLELYNLEDPEYVDKRRKEVGLGPLKEYLKQSGIEFTVKQKD